MWRIILGVLEAVVLFALLHMGNRWTPVLGGAFHAITSYTLQLPRVGRFFDFLLRKPMYLNAVTKPLGWIIASSGVLLGLGVHNLLWGSIDRPIETWILFVVALLSVFETIHEVFTFELDYVYLEDYRSMLIGQETPFVPASVINALLWNADRRLLVRLARAQFLDMMLVPLLKLLVNFGVIYYCLGQLDLLTSSSVGGTPPDLWQSLLTSFSLIDITGEMTPLYDGDAWLIIRLFSSLIIFVWLVVFITLASASVDESVNDVIGAIERERHRIVQQADDEAVSETLPDTQ